ncbi:MAG: septum site-determining protein MinC [Chloroflexi bacterium]|nr:septum site-determining protein MinC [Chloroflexota bacterium]MBI1855656.1 septum site-determining protein MinC [Chloroflexota bacterium]MBI3339850.1 septum site-determining protein MinC [Chloroflexota bacterium]
MMNDLASLVQIKGLRDGLLVSLSDASWEDQHAALLSQIDEKQSFFQGARLALDVGAQILKVNEMVELRDQLSERNVSLWAVIGESPTTEKTAQLLGLATRISKPRPEDGRRFEVQDLGEETALFLNKTIRSGARIEFRGHIVVLGDVNPGAEIAAEGSIIIWGRLRGAVHAGSKGDEAAVVCALDFAPIRLQVAADAMNIQDKKETGKPEMAFIRGERVVIEPWQPGQ